MLFLGCCSQGNIQGAQAGPEWGFHITILPWQPSYLPLSWEKESICPWGAGLRHHLEAVELIPRPPSCPPTCLHLPTLSFLIYELEIEQRTKALPPEDSQLCQVVGEVP